MTTTNYAERLIDDINKSNKESIRLNVPIIIDAEVRTDTDYAIDLEMCKIAVDRFSVEKNISNEHKILIANGQHQITYFSKDTYDEIQKQLKK